jgi:hypothetical protein
MALNCVSNFDMTRRWQIILPVIALLVLAALTYHSIRMERLAFRGHHSRYFYWSSLPLDSEPSKGHLSGAVLCGNGDPTCFEFDMPTMWVDPGWLANFFMLTSAPAFIVG